MRTADPNVLLASPQMLDRHGHRYDFITRHTEMLANRRGRLRNRKVAEQRRESDLLTRDINRGHRTTRVKRLLLRLDTATKETTE